MPVLGRSLPFVLLPFLAAAITLGSGCSGDTTDPTDPAGGDAVVSDESDLRALQPGEHSGTIACGETRTVHHTGQPLYRALDLPVRKGQTLDIRVSAAGLDARAWLTSASNGTLASNDDADPSSRDARIVYTAKSSMIDHVVFREAKKREGDFTIRVSCTGEAVSDAGVDSGAVDPGDAGTPGDAGGPLTPPSDDPFDAAACQGPIVTRAQAIAKIGAGKTQSQLAPARKLLMRKRTCNGVTGCSAWGATVNASHTWYMASGGDNYNALREYDVAPMLTVQGNAIWAVVQDVSHHAHCPACTPSGLALDVDQNAVMSSTLYLYYPRWSHTSSGFQLLDTWASLPLGPKEATVLTVTDDCLRATVLATDLQTEYGVLFRY